MTTAEFLSHLRNLGITLWAEGDRLRCRGPEAAITPALQADLSKRKSDILEFLKEADRAARSNEPLLQPVSRDGHLPLSFGQQRLWFLDQLEPGSSAYNLSFSFHHEGPLNVGALEQSLDEIIKRHESLRTTFAVVNGEPVQVVSPAKPFTLPVVDLSHHSEAERDPKALRVATEEVRRPFDLAYGPLFRTQLLRLSAEDHVFIMTVHHIVSDGWSLGILRRELKSLYDAISADRRPSLPDLPIQYADFSQWQREWVKGDALENQLDYWKKKLIGAPPLLELPTDYLRPTIQTFHGARQPLRLSKSLTESIKKLGRHQDATFFMTLLAAFKVLLYRYTGEQDIVVGTPMASRNRQELERLVGFFVNTLVLRTDLAGAPSFRELLARVREVALGAYAHQDLPFEKLVEELQPVRNASHSPLFQVMFILQATPEKTQANTGLKVKPFAFKRMTAMFDLTLSVSEREQGMEGWFEFNTDLFDSATIARMAGHFVTLLEGITADPDRSISTLPLLTESERQQLLLEWNDTQVDYPKDLCTHQMFEAKAEQTPDAVAVVFPSTPFRTGPSTTSRDDEGQELTYRDLNHRANQLAHHLRKLGVGPEVLVGICIERSVEMVVGLLGTLKAGGAYVPLDPEYPKERLAFILEDSGASVLLTQRKLLDSQISDVKSSISESHVVLLDDFLGHVEGSESSIHNPQSSVSPDNLAYVIYTSGSTGRPKGVPIPHRAVMNFLNSMSEQPGLTDHDTLLAVTTLSFDIAGLEIFLPLVTGARAVIVSRDVVADGGQLLEELAKSRATAMQATPATWRLLLEAGWQGSRHLKVLCGGEALPQALAGRLLGRCSSLWNMYGPTETTVWSVIHQIGLGDGQVPIGRPIGNTQIYILDSRLQPVPVGIPGELHIGGDGLARGYLNRPELTVEKFIPDPFSDRPGARLYKTGDLARYLPDGNIEFLGRIDYQVKIRGFRIELGEIEAVLGQHPNVRETVVVAREDQPGDKRLVAYLVARQGEVFTVDELRSFLQQKLPDYMIPSAFVLLEALPLTPNGKVDRKALPAPDQSRPELREAFVAPRSPAEKAVAEIWSELIGIDQVGSYDNFFNLGGHSLLATQVMFRLQNVFGVVLPLRSLFENPTVEGLVNKVAQVRGGLKVIDEIAETFKEVNRLSPEEVRAMLLEQTE